MAFHSKHGSSCQTARLQKPASLDFRPSGWQRHGWPVMRPARPPLFLNIRALGLSLNETALKRFFLSLVPALKRLTQHILKLKPTKRGDVELSTPQPSVWSFEAVACGSIRQVAEWINQGQFHETPKDSRGLLAKSASLKRIVS